MTKYKNLITSLKHSNASKLDSNYPKIYHIGESHCLSFAHSLITIGGKTHIISPRITLGAKAYHFSTKLENHFKSIAAYHLKKAPTGSIVLISFGEIDCRADEGIIKAASQTSMPIDELIEQTVHFYMKWFLTKSLKSRHKLFFFNIPAPVYNPKYSSPINKKVAEVISLFNSYLLIIGTRFQANIIDVYSHTVGKNGFSNKLYHCDRHHLDCKVLPFIRDQFSKKLLTSS